MKSSVILLFTVLFAMLPVCAPILSAQDMDTLEGVYREQYDQLKVQESGVQQQMESLKGLKSGIDDLIGQVRASSADSYAKEADRYRQLQLLLPSAIRYCEELDRAQKQLDQLQQKKMDLKSRILERQSSMPIWWTE